MNHLHDLFNAPWALAASHLQSLEHLVAQIDGLDMSAIEARIGMALPTPPKPAVTTGSVAVVPVSGYILPRSNILTMLGLATSADALRQQIAAAKADPAVKALLVTIDSPGGSVHGSPSVADAVRDFGKPTAAVADGQMASAAYWIGSAADHVYASEATAHVGSIGIVAVHEHRPATGGRVTTEITSGKYKRIASGHKPLSAEGADYLQAQVDELYSVFLSAVAANRGVSMDRAHSMADGRTFIGQQAVDAGLIDGIRSISQIVAQLSNNPTSLKRRASAPGGTAPASSGRSTPTYAATVAPLSPEQVEAAGAHALARSASAAATSIVDVFFRANRTGPQSDVRALRGRSLCSPSAAAATPVALPATATRAPIASDPRPDPARASACQAVAASAVALFKSQGAQHHE